MTAMKLNAAAAPLAPVGDLIASPLKCFAPVPAATHQQMNGGIQRKASNLWMAWIPRAQMIQTTVQMRITPAQVDILPSERA